MRVRFQADASLNSHIVAGLKRREPTIDFQTAGDALLEGLPDPQVLVIAAREGRVLVTSDVATMPAHFGHFVAQQESPGVIVAPQDLTIADVIEDLLLIWATSEAEEWINVMQYLPL
jgi:hypothetical protein